MLFDTTTAKVKISRSLGKMTQHQWEGIIKMNETLEGQGRLPRCLHLWSCVFWSSLLMSSIFACSFFFLCSGGRCEKSSAGGSCKHRNTHFHSNHGCDLTDANHQGSLLLCISHYPTALIHFLIKKNLLIFSETENYSFPTCHAHL